MNKRTRGVFYTIWTAAILFCLILALFAAFLPSCTKAPDDGTAEKAPEEDVLPAGDGERGAQAPAATPEATPVPAAVTLAETADQGQEYIDKFVFLGDSTTYGLAANGVLPQTQVWTPESGTLTLSNQSAASIVYYEADGSHEDLTIADAIARRQPEYLVITLGVNGISFMSEEEFKTQYTDLINTVKEASPATKILCQSIFPVIDSQAPEGINNQRINTANGWILSVAEQTGTRYLNTHDALMDETGALLFDYSNGDGMHLSAAGGQAVLQYIRTHAYQ